jgi:Cytidine and deoxycytidylate deaminase zinc-binding region
MDLELNCLNPTVMIAERSALHGSRRCPKPLQSFSLRGLQARTGLEEGGIPIGAVLVENGMVVAEGRNRRVQQGDPIAHGEMDCLR